MSDEKPTPESAGGLGALQSEVLADATHTRSDVKMVGRAIHEGWDVPADKRPALVQRLMGIVEKTTVKRWVGGGEMGPTQVDDEERADAHAIGAMRVLVSASPPTKEVKKSTSTTTTVLSSSMRASLYGKKGLQSGHGAAGSPAGVLPCNPAPCDPHSPQSSTESSPAAGG